MERNDTESAAQDDAQAADDENPPETGTQHFDQEDVWSVEAINRFIQESQSEKGEWDWRNSSDEMLWSAIVHGHQRVSVGYGDENNIGQPPTRATSSAKERILRIAIEDASRVKQHSDADDRARRAPEPRDELQHLEFAVDSFETLVKLRNSPDLRYLEPADYRGYLNDLGFRSDSGCSKSSSHIHPDHVQMVSPKNAQVSWNYYPHNIPDAWSTSTGEGITVGLIDTGVSRKQKLLDSSGFASGDSKGRSIERLGTFVASKWWWAKKTDGFHDDCGHGTTMAGVLAGPRNRKGMPVGIAYKSNLVSYRATEDVLINSYHEKRGVANALVALADRDDVRIISMSLGFVWKIGKIADAVRYAHKRGKLIFAAAGTSFAETNEVGVIFPANMKQVLAVTGIQNTSHPYRPCERCHFGPQVEFAAIMQDTDDLDKRVVTLAYKDKKRTYTGGSSAATAMVSGMAALVWSRHKDWTREQVLQRMRESASRFGNKDRRFGYGVIDAQRAVQ